MFSSIGDFISELVVNQAAADDKLKDKSLLIDNTENKTIKPKRKSKHINRKEQKRLSKVEEKNLKYEIFKPLNSLWTQYIKELIEDLPPIQTFPKLIRADFHGCLLNVVESKSTSLIGIQGILIKETANTLVLITLDDEIKHIPKKNTNLSFDLNGHRYTLYASQIIARSGDRVSKKFKGVPSIQFK